MRSLPVMALALAAGFAAARADEPDPEKPKRQVAPGDARIFEEDLGGAYFIDRPLMEKYEALRRRTAELRADIVAARIDGDDARAEIARLQSELGELQKTIDNAKRYFPGATIHRRTETIRVPIGPDDLLLVDAENVEIRGWDGPDIQCAIEKTVLDDGGGKVADDFAGIKLVARRGADKEFFGFYLDVRDRPQFKENEDMQRELRRFVFPDFLGREFSYLAIAGLDHEGGNRQIDVSVRSERGDGFSSSRWRRHATLTLLVPKCRRVGVRGGLGRLRVEGLDASLSVLGQGNRDYAAEYRVADLGGSLAADNIPIHRIDGVRGDVAIAATAYGGNRGTDHGPDGVTARAFDPGESAYRDIDGALTARFCRANLSIGDVGGRVDVENDFGDTIWDAARPLDQEAAHRVVSQGGAVVVRLGAQAAGGLKLGLFTEVGKLRRGSGVEQALGVGIEEASFDSAEGDTIRRSWTSWTLRAGPPRDPGQRPDWEEAAARRRRAAEALHGRPRSPGIDVISRAGMISVAAPKLAPAPGR
jgi:hypothetical protein